ncbi:MAG: hypothetical protein LAT57_00425 [Balneolales bacterium]|nr:hypothetical protein [Balneolales bacterium]
MTTAKKIDFNFPVLRPVDAKLVKRVQRKNTLLVETEEIFMLMGWNHIPDTLKLTIAIDMMGFQDEIKGLFSTRDQNVLNRRKRIFYWVNNFLDGECELNTAVDALKVSYLS